jgi:site-specific DNA-cytosine methylase
MNVLSLFDGISCGQLALSRAGVKYNNYYASEIDKYAKIITQKNFPKTFQLGDINNWKNWGFNFNSVDLILAGFPCQAWSVAGKQKGDNDPRGALVHTLVDIWDEVKKKNPSVKFLFENVKMKKDFINYINNLFGVEPIEINSALVSAQNRKRLYWTNNPNDTQLKDKNTHLK